MHHTPVLLEDVLEGLSVRKGGMYLDGTVGEGGHTAQILSRWDDTRVLGIDRDAVALGLAQSNLSRFGDRLKLYRGSYAEFEGFLEEAHFGPLDGFLLDLGVSSMQLDDPARGFSFMEDGPLDMRMDQDGSITALDVVNEYSAGDLKRILVSYGEEKRAGKIASAIVKARDEESIRTTGRLKGIVTDVLGMKKPGSIHPATRTFQAIRIEVNGELDALDSTLEPAAASLKDGGRMAVISFHSLEDRIVKNVFRRLESPCTCPPAFPICVCEKKSQGIVITKRPISPGDDEKKANPRSRSAKLRVFERRSNWEQ